MHCGINRAVAFRGRGRRWTSSAILAGVLAAFALFAPSPARADVDYTQVVHKIAELAFHYAWPTAEYETYECCNASREPGRIVVTFRLHGRSAFGGGPLWTDVNIALGKSGIEAFSFGDNNAILAQPGQTMGAIIDVLRELNAQARASPVKTPPVAPPPPPADAVADPSNIPPPPDGTDRPVVPEVPPPPPPSPVASPPVPSASAPPSRVATYLPPTRTNESQPSRSPGSADRPGLRWFFRLNVGGESGSEKLLALSYPNHFGIVTGNLEVFKVLRLGGQLYTLVGATLGAGEANGNRCTVPVSCQGDNCTCPSSTGRWQGFAGRYGPAGGLAFADNSVNGFYTVFWLPKLRVEHVVAETAGQDASCEAAYGKGKCSGWSFANVAFTGSLTFDFGHAPWGCGLELGLGALVGDLASREHGWLMADIQFAYSVGF